jgi:hypothetical protein
VRVEVAGASLAAVVEALRGAGFEPAIADAPKQWSTDPPRPGAWIRVPGDDANVVVVVTDVMPADRGPAAWQAAFGRTPPGAVSGYRVSFHERPFRTRGHPYADAAAYTYSVFVDDVVDTVREWAAWESTWSVTPTVEPAGRRLARLRRVAGSRLASPNIPVDVDLDPLMVALLDAAQAGAVHRQVDALFLAGIRWRFPRDNNGVKLATRTQVLLDECVPPAHPNGKGLWLVVDGPAPRAEQRLTIRLAHAVGTSAQHRWDTVPEYWHTGPRTLDQLWGIDAGVTPAFVEDVVDNLLAGRAIDALAMCGVTTDRGTLRLLTGLPDRFELRDWTDKWVTNSTALMAGAAPWLWSRAVAPRRRPRRLSSLGGFNPNRRPGLFLDHHDGHARVSFDQSASPLVVPRVRWQRDIDHDLVHLGLIARDQIPMPAR